MPCSVSFSVTFNAQLFKLKVAFLPCLALNPLSLKLCLAGVFSFNKVVHKPLFPDVGHKWTCQGDNVVSPFEGILVYSQRACSHVCIQSVCLQSCLQLVCLQSCLYTVSVPAVMSTVSVPAVMSV